MLKEIYKKNRIFYNLSKLEVKKNQEDKIWNKKNIILT